VDDDCSGQNDEDYDPHATSCGVGACAANGATSCVGGEERNSCTAGQPAANDATCNGVDDDCDGQVDEDGNCCTPTGDEVCDEADNDCDGETDEGLSGIVCGSNIGKCRQGATACIEGQLVCQDEVTPTAELCNREDDDCDGVADDYPDASAQCGVGRGCVFGGCTAPENGIWPFGIALSGPSQLRWMNCTGSLIRTEERTGTVVTGDWRNCMVTSPACVHCITYKGGAGNPCRPQPSAGGALGCKMDDGP